MNAKKFTDANDQSVWSKELNDGKTQTSVCIEVNDEVLDYETGYVNTEKSLVWIKGTSSEAVTRQQDSVIKMINNGTIKPYRSFSKTPFYTGQTEDVNPSTGALLGRYSQTKLCPSEQHASKHRQYVVAVTAPPEVVQPEIKIAVN